MNLFDYEIGGVYKIYCKSTQYFYIGQTFSFLYRANQHLEKLKNQTHECKQMQKDFNLYSKENFIFDILYFENDQKRRTELEITECSKYSSDIIYNSTESIGQNLLLRTAQRIRINGKIYSSIRKASQMTNESKTSIIRKLDNPQNLFYSRLNTVNFYKYQVLIDDQVYISTREVVNSGLAQTTQQIRRQCRSKKWPNWTFKDRSNDYPIGE